MYVPPPAALFSYNPARRRYAHRTQAAVVAMLRSTMSSCGYMPIATRDIHLGVVGPHLPWHAGYQYQLQGSGGRQMWNVTVIFPCIRQPRCTDIMNCIILTFNFPMYLLYIQKYYTYHYSVGIWRLLRQTLYSPFYIHILCS